MGSQALPDSLRLLQGNNPALNFYFGKIDHDQYRSLEARALQEQRELEQAQRGLQELADPFRTLPPDARPTTFRNPYSYFGDTQGFFPATGRPRGR